MCRISLVFVMPALLFLPICAKAGTLDKALLDESANILAYLKKQEISNVGVLPFRVKRGAREALYAGGPIATTLPRRIENALIVTMAPEHEKAAIGIIRDAALTASQRKVGSYRSKQSAFEALFEQQYQLAWGGKKVYAQAFLTGEVDNSGRDRRMTRVKLELFDADCWKNGRIEPRKVWQFEVRTDAALAADLGYNFSLTPAVLKRGVSARQVEEEVNEQTQNEDQNGEPKPSQFQSPAHTPTNIAGFEFELCYDGVRQELKRMSGGRPGAQASTYTAPPAREGSKISMYLTRVDDSEEKLGVLLLVNGRSTLDFETGEPVTMRKWIYGKDKLGQRDEWLGFYESDESGKLHVREFKVLNAVESAERAAELGTQAGWINIYVFGSAEEPPSQDEDEKVLMISTRGMPKAILSTGKLQQLRQQLLEVNRLRVKNLSQVNKRNLGGGLIVDELEPKPAGNFNKDQLVNPRILGHLAIRYYEGATK